MCYCVAEDYRRLVAQMNYGGVVTVKDKNAEWMLVFVVDCPHARRPKQALLFRLDRDDKGEFVFRMIALAPQDKAGILRWTDLMFGQTDTRSSDIITELRRLIYPPLDACHVIETIRREVSADPDLN